MIIIEDAQGTPAWMKARCGLPTASVTDMIITTKGEPSKQRDKLLYQLAGERLTGAKMESYQNGAMTRGIEMEAEARAAYELWKDVDVQQVGLCLSDCGRYGASPDGIVGKGGLEIKSPTLPVAVEYLDKGKLPTAYFQQVHTQILVCGFEWVDFVSYYPGLKPLIIRVLPDHDFMAKLSDALDSFCAELDTLTARLAGE